jgi:excisionase family DNA binding protein
VSAQAANGRPAPSARVRPVAALLVTRAEAAKLLAMSLDHFERHVQGDLRVVRSGALVLIPVRELERWVEENAARTLGAAA